MSKHEWEHGTITLPSAEVAAVKKAVRDSHNRVHDAAVKHAKQWFRDNKTQSVKRYSDALAATFSETRTEYAFGVGTKVVRPTRLHLLGNRVENDAAATYSRHMLERVLSECTTSQGHGKPLTKTAPLRTVQTKDATAVIGERATNRTTTFVAGHYGTVTFTGSTVAWDVDENNHAVDNARCTVIGVALFNEFNRITKANGWTSRSGGTIVGNDEYNREADWAGGGST
jgi:hypothetical protein